MPELEESLDEALEAGQSFELHDDFVEACEDYEACQRALADSALKDYAADFQDLSLEIEREIRRYLARYAGS
jgi:hypothetical protein